MFDKVCLIYLSFQDNSGSISIEEMKEMFGGDKIPNDVWKQII